jgi:hypothetical protein
MSQRESGYERKERDLYETPEWVTVALLPHIRSGIQDVWEPACGSGKMVRALSDGTPYIVRATDIADDPPLDFLETAGLADAVITNPPYTLASEFIWHALKTTRERGGVVAMLLRTDFDHAKTRLHLFDREQFAKKLVLLRRIRWFEDSKGSPSFNHAWFIWDWKHKGPPALAYATGEGGQ